MPAIQAMTAMTCRALAHSYTSSLSFSKRSLAADALEHGLDMGNGRFRHDAVPEIENERPLREGLEHRIDRPLERRPSGHQHQGIEIALHRHPALHPIADESAIHGPIDADGIDRQFVDVTPQERTGATREADHLGA